VYNADVLNVGTSGSYINQYIVTFSTLNINSRKEISLEEEAEIEFLFGINWVSPSP
jgi:hypothetical protein